VPLHLIGQGIERRSYVVGSGRQGVNRLVKVYLLYMDDKRPMNQTYKLEEGVACRGLHPKRNPLLRSMAVDILQWLAYASGYGASITCRM
jgi:hypothetical protein